MFTISSRSIRLRVSQTALTLCCSAAFLLGAPARAADIEQVNGSLKQIPADAAFYSSMLRNREQGQGRLS